MDGTQRLHIAGLYRSIGTMLWFPYPSRGGVP